MRDDQILDMFEELLNYFNPQFSSEQDRRAFLNTLKLLYKMKPKDYQ